MLFRHALHNFSEKSVPFDPAEYSAMKFGNDMAAQHMGEKLADSFFERIQHTAVPHQQCVLLASPYNVVQNAASIMAHHFMHKMNVHLCTNDMPPLQVSHIHRTQTYTADYGKMSHEERVRMIGNDQFSVDKDFTRGKTLIIVDDVRITGTHEHRLEDEFRDHFVENNRWYLYYANCENVNDPSIEATLNFSSIQTIFDLARAVKTDKWHVLIRPIKMILSSSEQDLLMALPMFSAEYLKRVVSCSYAERYHLNDKFKRSLSVINYYLSIL